MPTHTFFHLPDEKQQRLLEAARIEFSRAPLNEASIANIVKLAEIPRGSFYQYFEDKEDLYFYYFDLLRQDSKRNMQEAIIAAKGDLFKGFENYFPQMIRDTLEGENSAFYRHLFMNMDYRSSKRMTADFEKSKKEKKCQHQHKQGESKEGHGQHLVDLIDMDLLKVEDKREFDLLIQLLMHAVYSTVVNGYKQVTKDKDYPIDLVVQDFRLKINWLRDGAQQQKEGK
ncbi:TetR family transcriptional regulator [Enterococcus sp. JM4C]|uniref:TetR/AcrR family transcriptional regulator n=1 Tax=Candidatus Enterococcus huntleyi TaxID=1857217 RepID=UPI00137ACFD7|nr:TetR/AcrR family transcriptional regulator [Enterococcus sp. JM4C]KAF1295537.1 TetR family transcriptional regulator [Enterococcus sp. JM4C]